MDSWIPSMGHDVCSKSDGLPWPSDALKNANLMAAQ